MANRTRPIILRLAVTEYEKRLIENKMQQIGTENFGAYARKMLIDGYIIKACRSGQPSRFKHQSDLPPHQLDGTLLRG